MPIVTIPGAKRRASTSQCQKPRGWVGRFVLWSMNRRHSKVTDWGLAHVQINASDTILDVGCGGGRTVAKLADAAPTGIVYGIVVQLASASELPFGDHTFDLVTAVETHFWWQDIGAGMREIFRVLKRGGRLVLVAEFYNGGKYAKYADRIARYTTMAVLDVGQHKALFDAAGFVDVRIDERPVNGWICVVGTKPS